jgi:hypothetical protein
MGSKASRIWSWIVFYSVTLLLLGLLAALFEPAARVLREIAQHKGQGPAILIPLAFLLLSFLYGFLRARREGKRRRWIAAYGWLMGSCALALLLLYFYLSRQIAG